uniref:Uncharacterized protein n=2 Tax=Cacopsylla melanoneura TaxID=428564 RepID=A0A8D8RZQ1_9HEMI
MYVIISNDEKKEAVLCSSSWIQRSDGDDNHHLKKNTMCKYYFPKRTNASTTLAMRNVHLSAQNATLENGRILGVYVTYDEARKKLPKACDTSELESDLEKKQRKRNKPERYMSTEESNGSSDDLPAAPQWKLGQKKFVRTVDTEMRQELRTLLLPPVETNQTAGRVTLESQQEYQHHQQEDNHQQQEEFHNQQEVYYYQQEDNHQQQEFHNQQAVYHHQQEDNHQ